jgi:selenophosphate synthase
MTTLNKAAAEVIASSVVRRASSATERMSQKSPAFAHEARPTTRDVVSNNPPSTTNGDLPVHALTDVTGFGLIGHLREMALASENVSVKLHAGRVPLLEGALECVRAGHVPGGLKANREFAECAVEYETAVPEDLKTIFFDPQTAGGLLAAVAADSAEELIRRLRAAGISAVEIGEVLPKTKPLISILL